MMKSIHTFTTAGLLLAAMGAAAVAGPNDGGVASQNIAAGSAQKNIGHVLCTAAINSDGTIAGGNFVDAAPATSKIGTGNYQVSFAGVCADIRAVKGWMRFVQVDTLTTGSIGNVSCNTADRAGDISGVFVNCFNGAGAATDASFMLQVSR